ncbi:MAG: acetolactate synthase [Planctomyces sp.]|nr:acetolactate synthase [Planctomyces sp.]
MYGRQWPCLRQFCVFMENRVGRLHDLMRQLERHDLRTVALSIDDSVDCAIVRLMFDNFERARELLQLGSFSFIETDIIGVELPETEQPFLTVCTTLLQAEINIHYTYPLLYRRGGQGAIALYVDDIDRGLELLVDKGHQLVFEQDLLEDDEYL